MIVARGGAPEPTWLDVLASINWHPLFAVVWLALMGAVWKELA